LSSLYLIRHGQAGTRWNYDALSDLGHQQASLLGQYLAAQKIPFKALIAGCLNRQQQTAAVFSEFAPLLSEADPRFKQDYQELLRTLENEDSPIHRAWTECDTQAMRAWMEGRYPCRTESWAAFCRRVLNRRASLQACQPGDAVAVFTSACPIAIWAASALGLSDGLIVRLAGVMYNSAVTTLRLRDDDPMLFTFNGVPHLNEPHLRTFR